MARGDRHQFLMSGLLEGWDWFDNGLQNLVKVAGYSPLTKSQSMMVLYISAGVTKPSEIARRMRLSRQAIRHISNQLVAMQIIATRDDPTDGRSKILSFTERSMGIRSYARKAIFELEATLRRRLGTADYDALKRLLNLDWGPVVAPRKAQKAKPRTTRKAPVRGSTARKKRSEIV